MAYRMALMQGFGSQFKPDDQVPREELGQAFHQIARDCGSLGEYERGLHFISLALQELGDDVYALNLRGLYRQKIGNRTGARESYEQAAAWPGA